MSGTENLDAVCQHLADGDNVILFSNHQCEGDPAAFNVRGGSGASQHQRADRRRRSHLPPPQLILDEKYPGFASNLVFMAGDRVVMDPIAVPFSMGRNLLCIYSKRHIASVPELMDQKSKHNRRTLAEMGEKLAGGGQCLWLAPGGGRDRIDPDTGKVRPAACCLMRVLPPPPSHPPSPSQVTVAQFDPAAIDMLGLVANKAGKASGKKTFFFPLGMYTFDSMPPPTAIGGTGMEPRKVNFGGMRLNFGKPVDLTTVGADGVDALKAAGVEAKLAPRVARAQAIQALVCGLHEEVRGTKLALELGH